MTLLEEVLLGWAWNFQKPTPGLSLPTDWEVKFLALLQHHACLSATLSTKPPIKVTCQEFPWPCLSVSSEQ